MPCLHHFLFGSLPPGWVQSGRSPPWSPPARLFLARMEKPVLFGACP